HVGQAPGSVIGVHEGICHTTDGLHFLRDAAEFITSVRNIKHCRTIGHRSIATELSKGAIAAAVCDGTKRASCDQSVLCVAGDRERSGTGEQAIVVVAEA